MLGKHVLIHEQILSVYCWMLDDVLLYMFISYQSMNFCILTSMCFGSSAVHRKETNGTSLKNFNQLCNVSCQKCQLDQEYARQTSFLPNLPWHGTDYNMINWFSATDISGFSTWPFFPCWPWGWRIPMNDQALDRIGMSDRLDGFPCVFIFDLFDGFCCVYILSSLSNRVRRNYGNPNAPSSTNLSSCVFSLPETGPFASNKSGSLSIWTLEIKMDPVPPLLKKTCLWTWLWRINTQNNKVRNVIMKKKFLVTSHSGWFITGSL